MKGEWTMPLPMILGHEAAGVVERTGAGVTRLAPGDHVVLNFRANCGTCKPCIIGRPVICDGVKSPRWFMFDGSVRLHKNGQDIHHFSRTASFAEYAVVPESGAVKVRDDMPLAQASLIGCSVMTGVGAAVNTAKVAPGSSVLVIGCGGVGLNVIQGAALAGADRIIAVDTLQNKLSYAKEFGATDTLIASEGDVVARVVELTGGGVDYAFEAICPGGEAVVVGMAPEHDEVAINALSLPRSEKVLRGSWYGSARPWVDIPKLTDLYMSGRIKIDSMISRTHRLEEINEAYAALGGGEVARSVIVFDS
jgi:S-(hydroxymethyl)glutathione dehydrogenase/alcohol dehydrogenase